MNGRALRSTLDPVLRGEVTGPDWRAIAALVAASGYLFLSPGEACSNQRNNPDVPNLHASRLQDLCAACRSAPAGVLPGAIDMYLLAGLYRRNSKVYAKVRRASFAYFCRLPPMAQKLMADCLDASCLQDDIQLGRQLATGGFGTVYRANLREEDGSLTPVVVKKVSSKNICRWVF